MASGQMATVPAFRVPALCPGGTVVCVGGGPSLTADDVDYCQGKATVIAVNDAWRLAPWADALIAADAAWWQRYQGVPDFTGLKIGLQPTAAKWPGVQILRLSGDAGIERDPTRVRTGRNTGAAAINLAVHFGATRILLLGSDMQATTDATSHWFGAHPPGLRRTSPYPLFRYQSRNYYDSTIQTTPRPTDASPNAYFTYQHYERLANMLTTRSNVYAVWITVGYFEVRRPQSPNTTLYPDGWELAGELGIDTGDVQRHRAFYIFDRSIPVGFIRGQDLNYEKALLVRRYIE